MSNLSSEHMQQEIASVIGSERCPNMEDRKSHPLRMQWSMKSRGFWTSSQWISLTMLSMTSHSGAMTSPRYSHPFQTTYTVQMLMSPPQPCALIVSRVNRAPWSFPCCTLFWEKRNTGQPPGRSIPSTSWTWMATSRRTLHFFHSQQVTSTDTSNAL